MSYPSIGIIALLVLLITNRDILRPKTSGYQFPAQKEYRLFILSILAFYVFDLSWGMFDVLHVNFLLYPLTVAYFVAMALVVYYWSKFVMGYLGEKNFIYKALKRFSRFFIYAEAVLILLNIFMPVMFWYDHGEYRVGHARYFTIFAEIFIFLLTVLYALVIVLKSKTTRLPRHNAIIWVGMIMTAALTIQIFFPLFPCFTIGCIVASCLLHSFIVEDEKEEYQSKLEESIQSDKQHIEELNSAWHFAYTDPLTGVKSKLAYLEATKRLDERIAYERAEIERRRELEINGDKKEKYKVKDRPDDFKQTRFAVVVLDINGLKQTNDTLGHEFGDRLITNASYIICTTFKHSPVFRIGGDEFAVILEGQDYNNRMMLRMAFDKQIDRNLIEGIVVVALGMSDFDFETDGEYSDVFERADQEMYERKQQLKETERLLKKGTA